MNSSVSVSRQIRASPLTVSVVLVGALASASVFYLSWHEWLEPGWIVLALTSGLAVFILLRTYPLMFVAGLLFVGEFKAQAASGLQITDPTFILIALTALGLSFEILNSLLTPRLRSIGSSAFSGQGQGIVTYIVFASILALSYLYALDSTLASIKLARFEIISSLMFFSPLILIKSERNLRNFLVVVIVLSLIVGGTLLVGALNSSDLDRRDVTRIGAGQLCGLSLLLLLYFRFPGRHSKKFALTCIPFLTVGLVASASRGAIVSFLLALIAGYAVLRESISVFSRTAVFKAVLLTSGFVVLSGYFIGQLPATKRRFEQKQSEILSLVNGTNTNGSAGIRLVYYEYALEKFQERPLIGWGIGSWGALHQDSPEIAKGRGAFFTSYPHNIILETALEEGLVGIGALLAFLTAVFLVLRKIRGDPRFAFLCPVCIFCFSTAMFSDDITNRFLWLWFGMPFAAARLISSSETQRTEKRCAV